MAVSGMQAASASSRHTWLRPQVSRVSRDPSAVAARTSLTEREVCMRPWNTEEVPAVLARCATVGLRARPGVGPGLEHLDAGGDSEGEGGEESGDEDGEAHCEETPVGRWKGMRCLQRNGNHDLFM
jgi:hypothetical protein